MAEKKRDIGKEALKQRMAEAKGRQEAALPEMPGNGLGRAVPSPAAGMQPQMQMPGQQMMMQPVSPAVDALIKQRSGARAVQGQGVVKPPIAEERHITGVGNNNIEVGPELQQDVVDEHWLDNIVPVLQRYKAGKASIDQRVVNAERWWKMRNSLMEDMQSDKVSLEEDGGVRAQTAWLHNVLTNKHADGLQAHPEANVLPREAGDKLDAWALRHILPVILEHNDFEAVWDGVMWDKVKTGTGVYQVVWDREELNGLGDICIREANILNLFWEPGVDDIQQSRYFFNVALEDKDELEAQYPELLQGKMLASIIAPRKMPHDDHVDTSNKVEVVDCYYKKRVGGRKVLHYVKYVGDVILYASENDPQCAETGFYAHGLFPFVFDPLFPVKGSPAGYGYIDICANPQTRIDLMNTAFLKNTMVGSIPRYFSRNDGGVNEDEYLDLNKALVHYDGNPDAIVPIDYKPLNGNYINFHNAVIDELRETSGNTETATGSSTSGVTAASGIAAMQEASGKLSRASTAVSWRCFGKLCQMVIELIGQFYEMPRWFRITGAMGEQRFIQYSNAGLKPRHQGVLGGTDLGYRKPVFDIKVSVQKKDGYSRLSQNELALQLYSLGFFNPQMTDQALMTLNMMDFDGIDELKQQIQASGTMWQQLQLYKAMAATLAAKYEPQLVGGLLNGGPVAQQPERTASGKKPELDKGNKESKGVANARERANTASNPGGSEV